MCVNIKNDIEMNKELVEKYNKKTEQVLKDCYDLPLVIAIIVAIVMFAATAIITKSLFVGAAVMVCGGALVPVVIYYTLSIALCNLAQNYKNNK